MKLKEAEDGWWQARLDGDYMLETYYSAILYKKMKSTFDIQIRKRKEYLKQHPEEVLFPSFNP